jgi:hypothetical protein
MKLFKKVAIWTFILGLIFVIQGLLLVWYFEDDIKQAAVQELNKSLNTPIKVDKIELNFFEHFPQVALVFPNVSIKSSDSIHNEDLLVADEISMLFNIWDIYQRNYIVKKLYVNNAVWNSKIFKNGEFNFNILKKSEDSDSGNFNLKINEIEIHNSTIKHFDEASKQYMVFDVDDIAASGDFGSNNFQLKIKSDLVIKSLLLEKISYLKNKRIKLNSEFSVDLLNNTYAFNNTSFSIEKLNLLLNGFIEYSDKSKNINLEIDGKDLNIQSFLSILPDAISQKTKDFKSEGSFYFKMKMLGGFNKDQTPKIELLAGLKNTNIVVNTTEVKDLKLNNVYSNIYYNNNSTSSISDDILKVEEIKGVYNKEAFTSTIEVSNFNNPYLKCALKTSQNIPELLKLFPIKNLNSESGRISIDVKLDGLIADLKEAKNFKNINSSGTINISNTKLLAKNYNLAIEQLNASLSFQKYDLRIDNSTFKLGESDASIKGYFRNIFSYLLNDDQELHVDATLSSNNINLQELLSSSKVEQGETYKFKLSKKLKADVLVNIKNLTFDLFNAKDIEGKLKIDNQILNAEYLSFQSQKGIVFSSINFDTRNPILMPMKITLSMQKVDISNLFREFKNFGIDVLTDKNIKGVLTSDLKIGMAWDENLNSNHNLFTADGKLLIENGELINFAPMLALSKYIDVNELKNLKFSNLENNISIKNSMIYIPDMEVKSNALNLNLSGTHNFNNQIDYHLKMLLSNIIKKKSKRLGDEQFGEIEDDGSGKTTLFIRMYGDATNPKFSLDKQMIKKKIAEDLKQERQEVKQILKDEFGNWFKKDKEFKEQLNEGAAEWEKDIPMPIQKKDTSVTKSNSQKSKLQKLKEKLKEPVNEEEY